MTVFGGELRPAGLHGWLQVAVIETAVSENDLFVSSTDVIVVSAPCL